MAWRGLDTAIGEHGRTQPDRSQEPVGLSRRLDSPEDSTASDRTVQSLGVTDVRLARKELSLADTRRVTDLPVRFVGTMSGPRGGWPVASLELTRSGDVVLRGAMWKLHPQPLTWQQGTIVRAENVRGAIIGRDGVRIRGRYGMRAIFWCHDPRQVIAALVDIGVPAVWSERPTRTWGRWG